MQKGIKKIYKRERKTEPSSSISQTDTEPRRLIAIARRSTKQRRRKGNVSVL